MHIILYHRVPINQEQYSKKHMKDYIVREIKKKKLYLVICSAFKH